MIAVLDCKAMRVVRRVLLSLLASYCICVAVLAPGLLALSGGGAGDSGSSALEHRLKVLEDVKGEHRITRLETQLDGLSLQIHGAVGGVGALLVEAVFRIGKRKTKGGE